MRDTDCLAKWFKIGDQAFDEYPLAQKTLAVLGRAPQQSARPRYLFRFVSASRVYLSINRSYCVFCLFWQQTQATKGKSRRLCLARPKSQQCFVFVLFCFLFCRPQISHTEHGPPPRRCSASTISSCSSSGFCHSGYQLPS